MFLECLSCLLLHFCYWNSISCSFLKFSSPVQTTGLFGRLVHYQANRLVSFYNYSELALDER